LLDSDAYNDPSRYKNVGCLYCGKDIGPIRLLKDREFCTSAHRQRYHSRLGKVLGQLATPEDAPARVAEFRVAFPIQEGNHDSLCAAAQFGHLSAERRTTPAWTVSVASALGGGFLPGAGLPGIAAPPAADAIVSAEVAARLRMPRFELAAMGGIPGADEPITPATPPACDRRLPAGEAEPAERMMVASLACACAFALRRMEPTMYAVAPAGCYIRTAELVAEPPAAEPAAAFVAPVMDSRPALRIAPLAQLRFALHAVEDMAPAAKAQPEPEPVGEPAAAVAGPEPMAVESMPRIPAMAVDAIAPVPAMRLPALAPLTRPLTPAGAVAPPPAVAVESMPTGKAAEPRPMRVRTRLRKPTLAHFQTAEETSNALAAPAACDPPMAVESLPSAPAFEARHSLAPAVLMGQALEAPIRAVMPPGAFREPAQPAAATPEKGRRSGGLLEPMARIAAQPAGTQPERPKPAIPHPPLFTLDYYCQRITSRPTIRLEWHEGKIGLLHHGFQMKPALRPFAEYAGRSRKLLPFEEIFAHQKKDGEPARAKLSTMGKIAATIMVGVALWGGSRLAGLSEHAAALQARVAASERTVTAVAEVRRSQTGGKAGLSRTMQKIRHAIADRAATEVTDNFTSGMEAWGAGTKTWAAGWQHSAAGYVKTGEMALFQPSLHYTDYHMEFYGQIEEKSMGWVVRAQDKQNYYAMKFKVIEPGLRPIIAMVHYQVVNGKRGHTQQTPLSVMVHNNQPYHVSVDVRGNHFVAAIEGEPVDSWTDDAPKKGGVGFFSETGERARLYWMKIARNQDWLGRFCAYLSDSSNGQQTAELWGPEPKASEGGPAPTPPGPRTPDVALAVAGAMVGSASSPRRSKTSTNRRTEAWIS
jgi:hypothetical protein